MTTRLAFLTVFLISACGLGYQLIAGSVSSYLLGDSVTQFSLTIGLYLFALGIGSFISKFVDDGVVVRFIQVELAVAVAGGVSAWLFMMAFHSGIWFRPILYGNILIVGTLVGVEIPLLLRILKDELEFKDLVAKVLSFDYVGALVVALIFPLVMVPTLGLVRSALVLGILNGVVGFFSVNLFRARLVHPLRLHVQAALVTFLLVGGLLFASELTALAEHGLYDNEVVYAKTTPYQRIVVTRGGGEMELFLNGSMQFSSEDEYRYHEALVHPAMALADTPRRVLVLGGGDGLAVREILKHPEVERVLLVDIDPEMTRLARTLTPLAELNHHALDDPRVEVINDDAKRYIETSTEWFDVAILDFPDPHSFAIGKLYTQSFYESLFQRIAADGAVVVQSTNPRQAPKSFRCIVKTVEAAGFFVRPFHTPVPSWGEWGYVLGAKRSFEVPTEVPPGCRYLNPEFVATMFVFPVDIPSPDVELNRLNTQALVRYYEAEF